MKVKNSNEDLIVDLHTKSSGTQTIQDPRLTKIKYFKTAILKTNVATQIYNVSNLIVIKYKKNTQTQTDQERLSNQPFTKQEYMETDSCIGQSTTKKE